MTPSLATLLFAFASFVVTFAVARTLARWWKKKNAKKAEEAAAKGQSRQVRRARQRKKSGG